jgi:regulator of nucleoside diphosphate kinase
MMRRQILITENDMAATRQVPPDDLGQELERTEVVGDGEVPPEVVINGPTARVPDLERGGHRSLHGRVPGEADVAAKRISVVAPVGTP